MSLLMACSPKTAGKVETIVFDYSSTTSVYQYDRIEGISLIPLQTNDHCLIGESPELLHVGNNVFVKHGASAHRIDRFSIQGQYLNRIGRDGRGPGEISGFISSCFLYEEDMIGVHVYSRNCILLYDFAGDFVREVCYEPSAFMVHGQGSNFWALMPPQTNSARLICLSETGAIKNTMLESKKTYMASADLWRPFFPTNGKLYIGMPYENALYITERDTIRPAFFIDAGKYAIPPDFYNNPLSAWTALLQNGYASVYNFLESNDYYALQIVVQGAHEGMIWGIKHKQEKEWFWSKMEILQSGPLGSEYHIAAITEDNRLLILIPPYSLEKHLPFMKHVLNPQVAASVKEDDNPVLVEVRLR